MQFYSTTNRIPGTGELTDLCAYFLRATFRYFTSYAALRPAVRSAVVFRKMEEKTNGAKHRSIAVDTEDEDEPLDPTPENVSKPDKEEPNQGVLFYLVNNHMWIFAIWLIPISVFYDILWWFRARINYWLSKRNTNLKHEDKVRITLWRSISAFCSHLQSIPFSGQGSSKTS